VYANCADVCAGATLFTSTAIGQEPTMRTSAIAHTGPDAPLARWLRDSLRDVAYAVRQARRAPGASAVVVFTLAVGIGATAVMAGAVDRLLLRPPAHVRSADRLARVLLVGPGPGGETRTNARSNYPTFLHLERDVGAFDAVAAYAGATLTLGAGADVAEVRASLVSAGFFPLLGVVPAVGRVFTAADGFPAGDAPGGPSLAVLGYDYWQRQFAGDRGIVGRAVRLGDRPYTVVGVAPRGFTGVESEPVDVWVPMTVAAGSGALSSLSLADRGSTWLSIVARLAPGAPRAAAEQQATTVWRHYNGPPGTLEAEARVVAASIIRARGPDKPREVRVALWLAGVSALVLLIACANVANLLLARAYARRREVAVRLALGASRGRIARQLLAEGVLLAGLGGAAALGLAAAAGRLLAPLLGAAAVGGHAGIADGRLFAVTAAVALGTAIAVSVAPLAQSVRVDLTDFLRLGAAAGGGRTSRARSALLGVQAALCMVLLVGAGLFAHSLRRVEGLDLGLDLDRTLMVRFDRDRVPLSAPDLDAILARVREAPGVGGAALAEQNPYRAGRAVAAHTTTRSAESFWPDGAEVPMEVVVDSGFFRTVGATSLRGRDFTAADRAGAPRVAVINEPLARLLWPGEEPLGQCMLLTWEETGRECVTVVGVTRGFWYGWSILDRERLVVYVPLAQRPAGAKPPGVLLVAARGDPALVTAAVRQAIGGVRPDLPAVSVTWMRDVADPEVRPWRTAATLFSLFGGIALVIAAVGLYGVVAFTAAQRAPEIAVRRALGARPRHVLAVVAGGGLRAVAVGLAAGAAAALAARGWIGPLLFQTSPTDPKIVLGVAALLLAVAAVAAVVPTARALRRSPASVLRVD